MIQRYGRGFFILVTVAVSVMFMISVSNAFGSEAECEINKRFNRDAKLKITCSRDFHFYNADAYQKYYSEKTNTFHRKLQIGSFNLFQFGSKASAFKDLDIVARIINRMDVVAVSEIMPIMGRDLWHNEGIIKYLDKNPTASNADEVFEAFKLPGYLNLLYRLKQHDRSWSLILSPTSQANSGSSVSEYIGFYFRASIVKPIEDEHCLSEYRNTKGSYACFPSLGKSFMGDEYQSFFSRRPFLGRFQSGNFDFALLASHVIYNPPSDKVERKKLLNKFFNVDSVRDIPYVGVTSNNYARLVEANLIMKMMNRYKSRYLEKDIIYAGDMNINADNQYLIGLLWDFSFDILIDQPTTISHRRFLKNGVRTNGYSEDYDHFLYDYSETSNECDNSGNTIDFFNGFIRQEIQSKYLIRSGKLADSTSEFDYQVTSNGKRKMNQLIHDYRTRLQNTKAVKRGKFVYDNYKVEESVEMFRKRVFETQLKDDTYYRVYREIISDHMPIVMSCHTRYTDDD